MTISARKDLRTGRSIWERRRLPAIGHAPLRRDAVTDVLVVGAGISGALVADALCDAGLRVIVVDRRRPVSGSTAASTALIQCELDVPLMTLATKLGRVRAERVWRRSKLALDALRERIDHLALDADIELRDTLYLDGEMLTAEQLSREADARRRAGFEVTHLDQRAVRTRFGIRGRSALLSYGGLAADPRRLAAGFLNRAASGGARILSPVDVTELSPSHAGVVAATAGGPEIRARTVVLATGYELVKGVPRKGHTISSTWALATPPQSRRLWPERCFIWEASDPYLYLRVGPGNRIICGGEDEPISDPATRDALLPDKVATLRRKLAALLPGVRTDVDDAWCGSFGTSTTGTPSIGQVPRMPHCYAVLGFGGNGITFSAMAAQILRGLIAGDGDSDADLFAFSRRRG